MKTFKVKIKGVFTYKHKEYTDVNDITFIIKSHLAHLGNIEVEPETSEDK